MLLRRAFSLSIAALYSLVLIPYSAAANLAYSTYLKDGFTPTAMVSDAQGNLYLGGSVITDPVSGAATAVVAKLDPHASGYLYYVYLDGAASDSIRAIAVDSAGDAYITGSTVNPNFPITGGKLGTAPTGPQDSRSFVTKLSPTGQVIFSVLIGGSASSTAEAIALTAQGQILISGVSNSIGFPVTPGAYTVTESFQHPFLMELDAAADTVIFSATGIGGSSIALDAAGNIYVSGSTALLDYPTTPGAYQTAFDPSYVCFGLCQVGFPGVVQYLSKINASGTQLIYSTGVNGTAAPMGTNGNTQNTGLAVDAAGNAYVTGVVQGSQYSFTTAPPTGSPSELGFLTKLDPAGAAVLYSLPIGGGGVQIDSAGAVYVAGEVNSYVPLSGSFVRTVTPPVPLNTVPPQCLPNNVTANDETYVMKLDPATGAALDTQWIDGSQMTAAGLALATGKVWLTGATQLADVPFTAGAFTPADLVPGILPGSYLSAVDFTQSPAAGSPQIGCILDGANLMHAGPIAPNQLLALIGANLGPAVGINPPGVVATSIAGVSVTFDGVPAKLLYASASQINVLTPLTFAGRAATVMQVSVNGALSAQRQLPVTPSNPNLFMNLALSGNGCGQTFVALATNADGSVNSCTNPAKLGSVVSFYVHGMGTTACNCFDVVLGADSVAVVNTTVPVSPWTTRVDVQLPNQFPNAGLAGGEPAGYVGEFQGSLLLSLHPVGPVALPNNSNSQAAPFLAVWAVQ